MAYNYVSTNVLKFSKEIFMAQKSYFKEIFISLATDGVLGDSRGELAYAYLRVSSSDQADEGRSGLPRQMIHVHDVAQSRGYKIPWECIYADDDSGYEFVDRTELTKLRNEYKSTHRMAHAVVVEHLDRLSRNADWHQGYLLDEMRKHGLSVIFWKQYTSRIERAVMGAIAQEGMEQAKQRMAEGNIMKAKSGRVTARTPAFGYQLVDSNGNPGPEAKKDTHYGIVEEEAQIVRYIFEKVAYEGLPMRKIAAMLEDIYPPPKKMSNWEGKLIANIIHNPVYKGEFIAHRWKEVKIPRNSNQIDLVGTSQDMVVRRVERPRDEWIIVPVPAIVSPELWEMAKHILAKNKMMGRRNAKKPYLLTGLIRCATCGYNYVGGRKIKKGKKGQKYELSWYRCNSRSNRMPVVVERINCDQSQISARVLDDAVWSAVCEVLLEPEILIGVLDREYNGNANEQRRSQIKFLENQIQDIQAEDEKLYRAYMADVFDEREYAARRKHLQDRRNTLIIELNAQRTQIMTRENYEEKKRIIMRIADNAVKSGVVQDAPFEVKQRVIKTIVDKIVLNKNEGWFRLEGVIRGNYLLETGTDLNSGSSGNNSGGKQNSKSQIVSNPMGRDSWQPPVESLLGTSTNPEPEKW